MDICSYEECRIMFHNLQSGDEIKYNKYWVKEKINDKITIRLADKDDIDRDNFGLNDEDDLVPAYEIKNVIKYVSKMVAESLVKENERKFNHFINKVKGYFSGKR